MERYFTPKQVSQDRYCGLVSIRALEDMRRLGTGPKFIKFAKKVLYAESDLTAWEQAQKFSSSAAARRAA